MSETYLPFAFVAEHIDHRDCLRASDFAAAITMLEQGAEYDAVLDLLRRWARDNYQQGREKRR